LERTTLTRNLRPLEAASLVRVASSADQRSRAVDITEAGRRRLSEARPLWREAERGFRREFGRERAAALRALLAAVVAPSRLPRGTQA
jgi:DNA-binding MarR family transcriptional regulator